MFNLNKKQQKNLTMASFILVLIGAVNWGLVVFDFNIVELMGLPVFFTKLIYGLVGLSGVFLAWTKFGEKKDLKI